MVRLLVGFWYDVIMIYDVPFVSNTKDDLHCLQAAYWMILKFFKPEFEMDWDEWSKITGFEKNKGTWASAGLVWFNNNGFEVKHYELFDFEEFFKTGGDYLIKSTGAEIGNWQIKHSNIPLEQKRAIELVKSGLVEKREPSMEDVKNFLDNGYLLRVLVNSKRLNGKEGYFGHAVTVIGYNEDSIIFHDPGLPAIPKRKTSFSDFEAAWADPSKESKEFDAIRLKKK